MTKPVIDDKHFIAEMNARIPTYEGYRGGHVVYSDHGWGYTWEGGPDLDGKAFVSRAYAEIREAFTLRARPPE